MTLDEIFSDDNVEIYKKKNYVKLIREDEDIILTVDLKKRNGLESVTSRKYNKNLTKEETRDLIKELYYEEKLTQAEIADIVGLTQPQISVILKKY
ncbi:sigma factor-like helix-turn-helix DNA-binding protein [Exiguobacterium mexicanum]|uniref:sigma factor-like helix-turn-helix DNA-binding protein n=1 Tax=Exiguobacterium mexicanum TaxID=340146 RepID=UPI0037BF0594